MPSRRPLPENRCVLIVEDDIDARQMYAEYLRSKGWTVFAAADGRSGLTKVMELTPDAVVLDLAMPRVDGWTVLRQMRASSMMAHIPVVVVSAIPDARDSAIELGADAYLAKPCSPEVLYLQVRALTRRSGAATV
jgi:two-component system, OmpR family, response regulator CpxR